MYLRVGVVRSPRPGPGFMSGLGRMSSLRANRIVGKRLAALGYGDVSDGFDWSSVLTTGINDAASVAKVAVTPPLYSSVVNPLTGASSVTAYGSVPGVTNPLTSSLAMNSLFSSPLLLFGGLGLILVLAMRR